MDSHFPQYISSILEGLFNDKSHAGDMCTRLFSQIDNTQCRITEGQEVVDKQDTVVRSQEIIADTNRIIPVFRKRMDNGRQHVLHRLWFLFLDKDNRKLHDISHHK